MPRMGFQVEAHVRRPQGQQAPPWRGETAGMAHSAARFHTQVYIPESNPIRPEHAQRSLYVIGTTDVGQPVILIPSWLHFIMSPKRVAAQRTFCIQLFLLQIVCGHWLVPCDLDSGNMHGLEPVTTRIDGDDPNPYPTAPLNCA